HKTHPGLPIATVMPVELRCHPASSDDASGVVAPARTILSMRGLSVVDDADHHLLPGDNLADRLKVARARRAGLEGERVGIDLVERFQGRLVALNVAEDALLRWVAPAGVAPHLGLAAQPLDRVIEDLH